MFVVNMSAVLGYIQPKETENEPGAETFTVNHRVTAWQDEFI